jgi:hypothetical protein
MKLKIINNLRVLHWIHDKILFGSTAMMKLTETNFAE